MQVSKISSVEYTRNSLAGQQQAYSYVQPAFGFKYPATIGKFVHRTFPEGSEKSVYWGNRLIASLQGQHKKFASDITMLLMTGDAVLTRISGKLSSFFRNVHKPNTINKIA